MLDLETLILYSRIPNDLMPLFYHEAQQVGADTFSERVAFCVAAAEELFLMDENEATEWCIQREMMAREWDALMQEDFNDLDNYYDAEMRGELP